MKYIVFFPIPTVGSFCNDVFQKFLQYISYFGIFENISRIIQKLEKNRYISSIWGAKYDAGRGIFINKSFFSWFLLPYKEALVGSVYSEKAGKSCMK